MKKYVKGYRVNQEDAPKPYRQLAIEIILKKIGYTSISTFLSFRWQGNVPDPNDFGWYGFTCDITTTGTKNLQVFKIAEKLLDGFVSAPEPEEVIEVLENIYNIPQVCYHSKLSEFIPEIKWPEKTWTAHTPSFGKLHTIPAKDEKEAIKKFTKIAENSLADYWADWLLSKNVEENLPPEDFFDGKKLFIELSHLH